jgi:hypothetical protein
MVKGIDARDLRFLREEEFVEQLGYSFDASMKPLLRLFFRHCCTKDEVSPPFEECVFMCEDGWQVIDFASRFLPNSSAAGQPNRINTLAQVLQSLVKKNALHSTARRASISPCRIYVMLMYQTLLAVPKS